MFNERLFKWSLPYDRLIAVIHASPRLASHAPKVSMVMTNMSHDVLTKMIIIRIRLKIIASRAKSAIRRCWRCRMTQVSVIKTKIGVTIVIHDVIVCRILFFLWFTRPALQLY